MVNIILSKTTKSSLLLETGEKFYKAEGSSFFELADDNGYAYHKLAAWVVNEEGNKRISTACLASRAQLGKVNVSATGGSSVGLYEIDSEFYTVGDNVPDPESIRNNAYCHSELNNVLVANSIYQAGFDGESIRLATGLPLKQYFNNDGELNNKTIGKVEKSLKPLAVPFGDIEHVNIGKHLIYAESLSAFVDWIVNDEGEMVNEVQNGVLVVDVGGGTTDISFITPSNEIYMPGSDTVKTGVLDVFKKLKQLISSEYDVDEEHIRDGMLDKAIRTKIFNVRGVEKDCTVLVNKAKKHVAKRLNNFINDLVSATLDHIIFVGGGAEALSEQLLNLEEYPEGFVVIPPEPQFSECTWHAEVNDIRRCSIEMAKFEFFLDRENPEQLEIASGLSQYNTRVHAEVVRHAFVAANIFCSDLGYKAIIEKAGLKVYASEYDLDFNSDSYVKLMFNWSGSVKPLSLKRVISELRIIAKPARHEYLLSLFLIGNRLIKGEVPTASSNKETKDISYAAIEKVDVVTVVPTKIHSVVNNTKSALSGLMKRPQ